MSSRIEHSSDSRTWPVMTAIMGVGLAAVVGLFRSDVAAMVGHWNTSTYSYCYLIIPISLYLVWLRRATIARMQPRPTLWGAAAAPVFAVAWLAADAAEVAEVQQFALIALMQVLVLSALGWRLARALLFPLLYLLLLVPTGGFLVPLLQDLTTALTVAGLGPTGLLVGSEGNVIDVLNARYVVVEACAGLSFLLGALAFAPVYANLLYRGWRKRLTFVVLMLIAAILANSVRTLGIVLWNYYLGAHVDIGGSHVEWGWALFAVVILVAIWIGSRFRDAAPASDAVAPESVEHQGVASIAGLAPAAGAVGLMVIIAAAAPAYATYTAPSSVAPSISVLCLPNVIETWRKDDVPSGWTPSVGGADLVEQRAYLRDGARVDLVVAYSWRQGAGREIVGGKTAMADGQRWRRLSHGRVDAEVGGAAVQANMERLRFFGLRRTVWYWFWVDGRFVGSPLLAKLSRAKARLLWGERRAALIAVSAEETDGPADARARIRRFLASGPALRQILEAARLGQATCPRG